MIKIAKEAGLGPIQLTANAMLLDREISEGLITIGLDFISFSLDVLGKEAYETTRINGNYEKVIKNIENFLKLKEKKNLKIRKYKYPLLKLKSQKAIFLILFIIGVKKLIESGCILSIPLMEPLAV